LVDYVKHGIFGPAQERFERKQKKWGLAEVRGIRGGPVDGDRVSSISFKKKGKSILKTMLVQGIKQRKKKKERVP